MSTVVTMNGKTYVEPGSYAITVYQPTSVVNVASFGRLSTRASPRRRKTTRRTSSLVVQVLPALTLLGARPFTLLRISKTSQTLWAAA